MDGFVRFIVLFPAMAAAIGLLADITLADNHHHQTPVNSHVAGNIYAVDAATTQIFSDIIKNQVSAKSAFSSSSPECWMNSINTIHRWVTASTKGGDDDDIIMNNNESQSSGSSFFAAMTTDQQEIFALELTHCQLMKANRNLFDSNLVVAPQTATNANPTEVQGCAVGMGATTPYHASSCFPLMSEYAFGLYNTMFLHTREVCASLTEERRMHQKEVITHLLVGASAAVSQQMQSVLGEVTSVSEKLNEHSTMIEDMTTQTTIVIEQLQAEAILMAEHHKAHEQAAVATMEQMTNQTAMVLERVQEEVTFVIAEQQKAHEHATAMVLEKVEFETVTMIAEQHKSHERASALHIEEITQQTAKILERMQVETATIVAEQADKIKEQDHVIKRMNELLVRANEQMKPLSSIEIIVKMAEDGFAAFKVLVNFFLSMFIAWMITVPLVLRSSRRYLYSLFTMSLVVEVTFMLWLSESDQYLEGTGIDGHRIVRTWTRLAAVMVLVLFPMASCFSPPSKTDTISSVTMEDLVKVQMDLLAKLNEKIPSAETKSDDLIPVASNVTKIPARTAAKLNGERNTYDRRDGVLVSAQSVKSRSFQSPSMEQIAPVVTPTKRRADVSDYGIANTSLDKKSTTFYPNGFALEYMLDKGNDGDCSSSGDDASVTVSSPPSKSSNNKRTVSDIYSSGSEASDYFSAKDEEMSDSADSTVEPSPMKKLKAEEPHELDDHEVRVY